MEKTALLFHRLSLYSNNMLTLQSLIQAIEKAKIQTSAERLKSEFESSQPYLIDADLLIRELEQMEE